MLIAIATEEGQQLVSHESRYKPSRESSCRIVIRKLDEVLVGATFSHGGQLFRKMNRDCGVRKAKGRNPRSLTYLDPTLPVL